MAQGRDLWQGKRETSNVTRVDVEGALGPLWPTLISKESLGELG